MNLPEIAPWEYHSTVYFAKGSLTTEFASAVSAAKEAIGLMEAWIQRHRSQTSAGSRTYEPSTLYQLNAQSAAVINGLASFKEQIDISEQILSNWTAREMGSASMVLRDFSKQVRDLEIGYKNWEQIVTAWAQLTPCLEEWSTVISDVFARSAVSAAVMITSSTSITQYPVLIEQVERSVKQLNDAHEKYIKRRDDTAFTVSKAEYLNGVSMAKCILLAACVVDVLVILLAAFLVYLTSDEEYIRSLISSTNASTAFSYFLVAKLSVVTLFGTIITLLIRFTKQVYHRWDNLSHQYRLLVSRLDILDLAETQNEKEIVLNSWVPKLTTLDLPKDGDNQESKLGEIAAILRAIMKPSA